MIVFREAPKFVGSPVPYEIVYLPDADSYIYVIYIDGDKCE